MNGHLRMRTLKYGTIDGTTVKYMYVVLGGNNDCHFNPNPPLGTKLFMSEARILIGMEFESYCGQVDHGEGLDVMFANFPLAPPGD